MITKKQNKNWKENLIQIEPYVPGEQIRVPGLIKLNTNENPFPPSPMVHGVLHRFDADTLARYPSVDAYPLRKALSEYHGLPVSKIFVGNGSDEVLAFAFRAFFNSGSLVLFPDVSYSFYPVWCRIFDIPYEEIPLDNDFRIRAYEYDRPNGGLVIANPNAPTGIGEGPEFIEYLVKCNQDSIVIIDEAYADFGGYSAIPLLEKYDNLFIAKSFSKSRSLAGLRLGYGLGSETLISALNAVKDSINSYTVTSVAAVAGAASIKDEVYFRAQIEKIMRLRYKYMNALRGMGFTVLESMANFLFVTHPEISASELYAYLKERNILVRWFDKPRIEEFLRVTIGTEENMDSLLSGILSYIDGN